MPSANSRSRQFVVWGLAFLGATAAVSLISYRPATQTAAPLTEAAFPSSAASGTLMPRCAACHDDVVEQMRTAPHLNTLTHTSDSSLLEQMDGLTFRDEATGMEYEWFAKEGRLFSRNSKLEEPIQLDWLFGSGSHARTPVSILRDPSGRLVMQQHLLSWYPDHGLALTLGANDAGPSTESAGIDDERIGMEFHGDWQTPAETIACFRCHSETMQAELLDKPAGLQPGLGCTRCHVNAATHATEQGGGSTNGPAMIGWKSLTAREHVNRCGECHRRADQTPEDEITPQANHIVRFASVGLLQSRCFTVSEQSESMRMDCLTCHDPHQPASRSPAFYAERCNSCHGTESQASQCSQQPQSSKCVDCHMPKRETQPHLSFTDHWIRKQSAHTEPTKNNETSRRE